MNDHTHATFDPKAKPPRPRAQVRPLPWLLLLALVVAGGYVAVDIAARAFGMGFLPWLWDKVVLVVLIGAVAAAAFKVLVWDRLERK